MSIRSYKAKSVNLYQTQVGDKLQGLPPSVGKNHWSTSEIKHNSIGSTRHFIFNNGGALSGVGAGVSQFSSQGNNWTSRGGIRRVTPYAFALRFR